MSSPISEKVRVRFAPSPTGYLHVGGARSALFNYLFAKKNGGEFILRIEDTDEARSTEESLKMMIQDLRWLGLNWDEGPHAETLRDVGSVGPYFQSKRQDIYQKVAQELLHSGKAYYCFLTDEEIDKQRTDSIAAGRPPHVNSPYESWSLEQAKAKLAEGGKAVVRFKTRQLKKDYVIQDLVRGEVRFPSDMVGDFVLLRSDGMPVYNFCCVVDDHLMKMTHVLRAEEHLSNTLRQLMIYEAMSWATPQFGHVSLVLDEDKQKLSKRRGATSCFQFKELGYMPEALLNFIVLLGWSHPDGKEIFDINEMIEKFSLDRLNLAGAVFDRVKLKWMNAQYLRALSNADLWRNVEPFLVNAGLNFSKDKAWQEKAVGVFKTSMETFLDAVVAFEVLDDSKFQIHEEANEALAWEQTKSVLQKWKELIAAVPTDFLTEADFLKIQDQVKEATGAKGKFLFMSTRVAVIGKPHGTELKLVVPLIHKNSLVKRAEIALAKIG